MLQLRAYKYELTPTAEQCSMLAQFFGAKRWIYNHFLAENKRRFLNKEKHLSNFDCNTEITKLKQQSETSWLKGIDDWCLKHASEDLATGFKNFFDSVKGTRKGPKVSTPQFKSKYNRQSYRTRGVKVDFENNLVVLPKIKSVGCILHRRFDGTIKTATISKTPAGKYFISILVEEDIALLPSTGMEVGIDLGLKDLIILSSGVKFDHPEQMLLKAKRALKKQQRKLSKKKRGSKNYEAQRLIVAKCYAKVTNIRNFYYHNISRWLVNRYDAIHLENLNVAGMLKNQKLARKIQESAWSTLVSMINYKAMWAGRTVHKISRWFPSSKTCSSCGHKLAKLDLGTREWTCPSCGTHHDRDLNAAKNILNQGQLDCYNQIIPSGETTEVGLKIPVTLMKHSGKIERSMSRRCGLNEDGVRKPNCL